MKLIIAGSRTLTPSFKEIDAAIALLEGHEPVTEVVCGMAQGADLAGKAWADAKKIPVNEYPVTEEDWKVKGKKAGILRNENMGNYADCLLAFWDGKSNGTRHMISYMHKNNKPFIVINKATNGKETRKDGS